VANALVDKASPKEKSAAREMNVADSVVQP
jgi:hypothetical protein